MIPQMFPFQFKLGLKNAISACHIVVSSGPINLVNAHSLYTPETLIQAHLQC